MATTTLSTAEDLARLVPEVGYRHELIRGVLHRMKPAGGRHGEVGFLAGLRLGVYVTERRLGRMYTSDTGFVLARDPDVVVMPDVAFVRADRLPPEEEREGFMPLAPDLVIEVLSPTDRMTNVQEKIDLYLAAGTRLLWLIEPRRRGATVHRPGRPPVTLNENDVLDGEDVVPGFRLSINEILG